jgi:PGF-CTERM protein
MRRQLVVILLGVCLLGLGGIAVTGGVDTPETTSAVTAAGPAETTASVAGPAETTMSVTAPTETTSSAAGTMLASNHVNACAAEPPADHADPGGDTDDVIGWVEGYWYNESIEIGDSPLTQAELDRLLARTAARVEALRCLDFEGLPPTEMRTRDEHRSKLQSEFESALTESGERFDNALLSTTLIAGQSVDAVELQLDAQSSFPAAFYNIEEEFIGFITEDSDSVDINETTLAHELVHALQDQHFELESVFEDPTTDDLASSLAVVEGDASLVERQYRENCGSRWGQSCIDQSSQPTPEIPSWPLTLEQLAPYNMPLVADSYEEGGWEAVNNLLQNRPDSAVEAMYPDRYGEFEPSPPTIEDQSSGGWARIELENRSSDVFGQHALTAILMAPYYETNGQTQIIDLSEFLVGGQQEIDYGHPATDGWQGDQFYGYTNGDRTGGVWALAWENADEATTFADAFEDLAAYRGATLAEGYENVYTFENSEEYDMALGVERAGDRILVVTAPTVDALTDVHGGFDAVSDGTDDDGTDDGGTDDDGTDDGGTDDDGTDDGTGDDGTDDGGTDDGGTDDGSTDDGGADDGMNDSAGEDGTDGGEMDDGMDDSAGEDGDNSTGDDGASEDGSGAGFGVVVVITAIAAALLAAHRQRR